MIEVRVHIFVKNMADVYNLYWTDSDFVFEYGEWKYYDENGNIVKIKEFK